MSLSSFPRGFLAGAALMYFLDPARGRRRRAHLIDGLGHARRVKLQLLDRAARDAGYRIHGAVQRIRHPPRKDVEGDVLTARVTSQLGRLVSHPSAIEVVARGGIVTLRGPILAHEADRALRGVEHVWGVESVIDQLERHETAEQVPALQGEGRHRANSDLWTPSGQAAALLGGGLLAAYGWIVRRGIVGTACAVAGGVLALRGALNLPVSRIIGVGDRGEGVTVQKAITVHVPIEEVFALWSRIEHFPRFMQHVKSVERADATRSRWTVDGPAGVPFTFETITTSFDIPREIAWETVPDQPIEHSGRVRFERTPEGTRIDVRMSYRPPAGVLGHVIAHLLGGDPKARMDADLARMKTLLEDGHTRAHGERVEVAELLLH